MKNPKLGICIGFDKYHEQYVRSCEELGVPFVRIDLRAADWLRQVKESGCDGFLLRPPCEIQEQKSIYDERVYFLHRTLGYPVYPSLDEILIYENKRNMSYWLEHHGFPHPKTRVFSMKQEALAFADSTDYPVVFKANVGSAATAVEIVKNRRQARRIINAVFGRIHPLLALGHIRWRRLGGIPLPLFGVTQRHYLIAQEYKKIIHEWRIIRIGDSYFGHQKLLKGEFASGSGRVGWIRPPDELLFMVKDICERGGFLSMCVDIFETADGKYFINELQSIFGSYNDSQMYIDGVPGRLTLKGREFAFEEGKFNRFGSYLLRVKHFLDILQHTDRNDHR
ncbi:MAG TPA: hypothetical protein PLV42_07595 [bacterium]|nr:hypothetical protein [bacterium]